jgi:hypothetical protein
VNQATDKEMAESLSVVMDFQFCNRQCGTAMADFDSTIRRFESSRPSQALFQL